MGALDEILIKHGSKITAESLLFCDESWLTTSAKRHKFSAEHININLDETLRLLAQNKTEN
jgi:hypothetical protein